MSTEEANQENPLSKLLIIGVILALLGIGFSGYSLWHHMEIIRTGTSDAACNINDTISCDAAAKSAYSEVFGYPLGIYGLGFFAGLLLLLGTAFGKPELKGPNLKTYGYLTLVGLLVSIVLFIISVTDLEIICPTCVGVYVVSLAQVGLVIWQRHEIDWSFHANELFNGATYPLVALVIGVIAYNFGKPIPEDFPEDMPKEVLEQKLKELKKSLSNQPGVPLPFSKTPYSGLGEDYRAGSDNAKVVITEFADFECGHCALAHNSLRAIKKEFGNQILVVFRNFPISNKCNSSVNSEGHKYACEAAIAARCAGRYGKFWQMHNQIFDNQSRLDSAQLKVWAMDLGITAEQYDECQKSPDILKKVQDDVKVALSLGVNATPTIFINNRKLNGGPSVENIRQNLQLLLNL